MHERMHRSSLARLLPILAFLGYLNLIYMASITLALALCNLALYFVKRDRFALGRFGDDVLTWLTNPLGFYLIIACGLCALVRPSAIQNRHFRLIVLALAVLTILATKIVGPTGAVAIVLAQAILLLIDLLCSKALIVGSEP
jgi:hypothetical protein